MPHIACDVHTHTLYSRHAYSTIEENVRTAAFLPLELVGSTDHFSSMLFPSRDVRDFQYFLNYPAWPDTWQGVRLLHGCEADIVDLDGHLFGHDVEVSASAAGAPVRPPRTLKDLVFDRCDYVIASIHGKGFVEGAGLARTTEMYLNALGDPKVLVLGHTGRSGVPFDLDEVLRFAREEGKLIEINEHSLRDTPESLAPCRRIAERCAELGTMISVGSDAHLSAAIGRFEGVSAMLDEIHFPRELIASRDRSSFLGVLSAAMAPRR